jgi:hypothetical protein
MADNSDRLPGVVGDTTQNRCKVNGMNMIRVRPQCRAAGSVARG